MRRLFSILAAVLLMLASFGSTVSANGNTVPKKDSNVPVFSAKDGATTASRPKEGDVTIMGCVNTAYNVGRNPIKYIGWQQVALINACSTIFVETYNVNSANSVVVRVINNASGSEITPRYYWDSTMNHLVASWPVAQGTYRVETSAYTCCTSTSATFDVWTN